MNKLVSSSLKTVLTYLILFKVLVIMMGCKPMGKITMEEPVAPISATQPSPTVPTPAPVLTPLAGLQCDLYDLSSSPPTQLPNFDPEASQTVLNGQQPAGTPVATWMITGPIDFTTQASMLAGSGEALLVNYAIDCKGKFDVLQNSVYILLLNSDDGSRLLVDGSTIIQNDGEHGAQNVTSNLAATSGTHSIELQYFQGPGVVTLQLYSNLPMTFHQ
jgi:hypothetical protein